MAANAFDVLAERGFVRQVTDEAAVRALFAEQSVTVYVGYDPTADSLHVGHLFTLMSLMHLERLGHRPVIVLGGGTAMVGDPSGKTELRQMLEAQRIQDNLGAIRQQVDGLFERNVAQAGGRGRLVVNNGDWLLELRYIDFLRDIGRHFSVNRMLTAEAYKLRLEKGLSFIEFNYQLLQAYDFLQLCLRHDCLVQMGGDDQWGNIVAGVDLVRRLAQKQAHGITFPLLLTAAGEKMGKTAAGAVWLDPKKLSPYDYYQYWVNLHDDDVVRMLGFFTLLPMNEVKAVEEVIGQERNMAKNVLAYEATQIVHGEAAARAAHAAAMAAFGDRTIPAALLPSSKVPRHSQGSSAQLPSTVVPAARLQAGVLVVDLLAETGLVSSKSEARRLIEQGAVRLGERKIADIHAKVAPGELDAGELLLRAGKKKVHRLTRA